MKALSEQEDARVLPSRVIFLGLAILWWRDGVGVRSHLWGASKSQMEKVMAAILARSAMDRKRQQERR